MIFLCTLGVCYCVCRSRSGTFLGRLRVQTGGKSVDVATALLSAGLAKLHGSFRAAEQPGGAELEALEQKAKDARLKVSPRTRIPPPPSRPRNAGALRVAFGPSARLRRYGMCSNLHCSTLSNGA